MVTNGLEQDELLLGLDFTHSSSNFSCHYPKGSWEVFRAPSLFRLCTGTILEPVLLFARVCSYIYLFIYLFSPFMDAAKGRRSDTNPGPLYMGRLLYQLSWKLVGAPRLYKFALCASCNPIIQIHLSALCFTDTQVIASKSWALMSVLI